MQPPFFTSESDCFFDRQDAGRQLAARLSHLQAEHPVVLGLPRGGVVVAAEVAAALGAPLDVLVVRKLGAPLRPELAIGAVIDGNPPRYVLNDSLIRKLKVDDRYLEDELAAQLAEARRRRSIYRHGRDPIDVGQRVVSVVDDGVATGATVKAAIAALRQSEAAKLVLAVPVGALETMRSLQAQVDELVCLRAPPQFRAVGAFYEQFEQTTDAEVIDLLASAERREL